MVTSPQLWFSHVQAKNNEAALEVHQKVILHLKISTRAALSVEGSGTHGFRCHPFVPGECPQAGQMIASICQGEPAVGCMPIIPTLRRGIGMIKGSKSSLA